MKDSTSEQVIFDTLRSITDEEKNLINSKKKLKRTMILIIVLNSIASIFIGGIYFLIDGIVFLVIAAILLLTSIPTYFLFKKIIKGIDNQQNNN